MPRRAAALEPNTRSAGTGQGYVGTPGVGGSELMQEERDHREPVEIELTSSACRSDYFTRQRLAA